MATISTLALLHRAFNPCAVIMSRDTVGSMAMATNAESLSPVERIVEDSHYFYMLQEQLPDLDFRLLKLYYDNTRDWDTAVIVLDGIRDWIIATAGIIRSVDQRFIDGAAIGVFWNKNLFGGQRCGRLSDYGSAFTNCRRKKRIERVLENHRQEATERAEYIFNH